MEQCNTMCDITDMTDNAGNPALYDKLMALKPAHLTENGWTVQAGVNRSFFQDLKRGKTPRTDTLERVVGAIGLSMAQFHALNAGAQPVPSAAFRSPGNDYRPAPADLFRTVPNVTGELKDLPVLGTAEGADEAVDGNGHPHMIESMLLTITDAIEYRVRPPALKHRKDVYCLYITGQSMNPRYEAGELVYVDAHRPAAIGDYVIVQMRGEGDNEDNVIRVMVKRLVKRGPEFFEFEQFNPPLTFRYPKKMVMRLHRIMRTEELG